MRFSWARMAFVSLLAGVLLTGAMAQQSNDVRLDLTLKDADMMQATNILFMRFGINFVVDPSSEPYKKITLKIADVTPEEAIRYICQAAGAYFRRDENGVYVISHTKFTSPDPIGAGAGKTVKTLKRIKLIRSDPRDIYDMLVFRQPPNTNRGFDALKKFGPQAQSEIQRLSGAGSTPQNTQNSYQTFTPIQTAASRSSESSNDITLPGEEGAQQFGGGQGFGGGGGGGGIGGGQGGGRGGGAGGAGNTQLVGGQGLVPDSIDFISYDPTDNSLVVRGTEDDINQLQTYINLFDVAPKQVQIKVEFITTTASIDQSFGTEFLYQRGTVLAGTTPGSFVRASDPVFLNYSTGNITARLRTSLTQGGGKVVSAPILRTLNNQPASINSSIQTTIYINSTTVSNGAVVTSSNAQPLLAQTFLSVAPRINDDNTITVYLTPQIQSFVGTSTGPDGQQTPNVATQGITVVARVKNNETIVLGGLTTKNDSDNVTSVPVLSSLPIIGQFFQFKTKTVSNSELLIFVTPTIIEDDASGNTIQP